MTKENINFIFNQHGGKEKVIGEMFFEIFIDNPRSIFPENTMTKEEKLDAIQFNDDEELIIYKEKNKINTHINDYTPTECVSYIPYEMIQGIYITTAASKISFKK